MLPGHFGSFQAPASRNQARKSGVRQLRSRGFLVMPLVWSVPEALVTAELSTTFPSNSGFVEPGFNCKPCGWKIPSHFIFHGWLE